MADADVVETPMERLSEPAPESAASEEAMETNVSFASLSVTFCYCESTMETVTE